jgi:hypothetical protein
MYVVLGLLAVILCLVYGILLEYIIYKCKVAFFFALGLMIVVGFIAYADKRQNEDTGTIPQPECVREHAVPTQGADLTGPQR